MDAPPDGRLPKGWTRLAALAWLGLLVLAVVAWRERALFMDASFQAFHMLLEERLLIYHYRFCNALSQILPLAAIEAGLPLKAVLFGYSLNVWLLYFGLWLLLHRVLRHERLAWVWLLFLTLISLDSFYFIPPELFQGIGWMLLLWAWVARRPDMAGWRFWLVALVLAATFTFAHSLVPLVFFYCFGWFWLDRRGWRHRRMVALAALVLAVMVAHELWFTDWYDAMKKEEFWRHARQYWPRYHELPANGRFLAKAVKFYYLLPALALLMSAVYAWRRCWLKLAWMWGFGLAFVLLLHIGSPATAYRFYSEANYMPLSVVVALPFVFDGWAAFRQMAQRPRWAWLWPHGTLALLALMLAVRLNAIWHNHDHFVRRLDWMVETVRHARHAWQTNRVLVPKARAPMDLIVMEWSVPYESVLATALIHPDSAGEVFVRRDFERFRKWLEDERQGWFLSEFDQLPADTLPDRYIRLGHWPFRLVE